MAKSTDSLNKKLLQAAISATKASEIKKLVEAGKLECGEPRVDGRAVKSYTKVAVEDTETDEATEENAKTEE